MTTTHLAFLRRTDRALLCAAALLWAATGGLEEGAGASVSTEGAGPARGRGPSAEDGTEGDVGSAEENS